MQFGSDGNLVTPIYVFLPAIKRPALSTNVSETELVLQEAK